MRWEQLERAVAEEDNEAALRVALEGWRATRHPRYADLVDAFGRAPKFPGSGEAWLDEARRAEDLGPFLPSLAKDQAAETAGSYWLMGSNAHRYAPWLERLAVLEAKPDDPRVARALLEVITKAPWAAAYREDIEIVTAPALALIARIGDPRTVPIMRALLAKPVAKKRTVRSYLAEALPDVISAIRDVELEAHHLARVDALIGPAVSPAPSKADDDALFALVVADLANDEPRAVLGDHWLERGDPRGELVTQQLAGRDAKNLARKHEKAWLGDLALVTKNRVYRRGFLAEIELAQAAAADPAVWESAQRARDLATVEVIHKGRANDGLYVAFVEAAPGLRQLTAGSKALALRWLERKEPWKITHLSLEFVVDEKTAKRIAKSPAFPHLERVTLGAKRATEDKLFAAARVFADRGVEEIEALPIRSAQGAEPLFTEFLAAPIARERSIRTGAASRIIARDGLRIEIVCEYLYYADKIIAALRAEKVPIAEVALKLPRGVTEPHPLRDARALDALRGLKVVADAGWAKML